MREPRGTLLLAALLLATLTSNCYASEFDLDAILGAKHESPPVEKTFKLEGARKEVGKQTEKFDAQNEYTREKVNKFLDATSESVRNHDFVIVNADVEDGLSRCMVSGISFDNINDTPDASSPGIIYNKNSSTNISINKGINGTLAGSYRWGAKFTCGNEYCGGVVNVTGTHSYLHIRFYKDCSPAGTNES